MRVSVELIKEIHDGISLKIRAADDHVFLTLGSVGGVTPSELLALHPSKGQLLEL